MLFIQPLLSEYFLPTYISHVTYVSMSHGPAMRAGSPRRGKRGGERGRSAHVGSRPAGSSWSLRGHGHPPAPSPSALTWSQEMRIGLSLPSSQEMSVPGPGAIPSTSEKRRPRLEWGGGHWQWDTIGFQNRLGSPYRHRWIEPREANGQPARGCCSTRPARSSGVWHGSCLSSSQACTTTYFTYQKYLTWGKFHTYFLFPFQHATTLYENPGLYNYIPISPYSPYVSLGHTTHVFIRSIGNLPPSDTGSRLDEVSVGTNKVQGYGSICPNGSQAPQDTNHNKQAHPH